MKGKILRIEQDFSSCDGSVLLTIKLPHPYDMTRHYIGDSSEASVKQLKAFEERYTDEMMEFQGFHVGWANLKMVTLEELRIRGMR